MGEPKANCSKCGVEILRATFNATEGYCMPCYRAERAANPGAIDTSLPSRIPLKWPDLPQDTLVSVFFSPGFSIDLTTWRTTISKDGRLTQNIKWHKGAQETRNANLKPTELELLLSELSKMSQDDLELIHEEIMVCDAPSIGLSAPDHGVNEHLSAWVIERELPKLELSRPCKDSFAAFMKTWNFVDRHSPYSTAEHWKTTNKRMESNG